MECRLTGRQTYTACMRKDLCANTSFAEGSLDFIKRVPGYVLVLLLKLATKLREERAAGIIQKIQKPDQVLALLDLLPVLFAVIVDGDDLDETFLRQKKCSGNDAGLEDLGDSLAPYSSALRMPRVVAYALVWYAEMRDNLSRGGEVDDTPEKQGDGNFQVLQDLGVLPDARRDDSGHGLEHEREEMRKEFADPEGYPGDLEPDEESKEADVANHPPAGHKLAVCITRRVVQGGQDERDRQYCADR